MPSPFDGPPPDSVVGAIESRRTTRRFDPDRPLDPALLDRLLALAGLAPSPMNLQPWRFVVVREARNRKRLRACAFGDPRIGDAPAVLIVLAYIHPDRTDVDEAVERMLALGAIEPEAVARFRATATREWERGDGPVLRATRSAMLAVGTLMIAAEVLGVASSWIEGFDPELVREGFSVPDDHALCGLLALGFAAEPAPFPGRFGLDRSCFEEHFGRPWPLGGPAE
jgi:nitroreductase